MKQKLLQYVTPLRICTVYLIIQTIVWYIMIQKSIENGYNPELGGLVAYILGGLAIITFLLDLILSSILTPKTNWIVQFLLMLIGIFAFLPS